MTPEQQDSILNHREKMAAINTAALNALSTLAAVNAQAIMHHSLAVPQYKRAVIDNVVEQMNKVIDGQGTP